MRIIDTKGLRTSLPPKTREARASDRSSTAAVVGLIGSPVRSRNAGRSQGKPRFFAGRHWVVALALLLTATTLQAHVKWFASYDLTKPMTPATDVLSQPFILLFLLSVVLVYVFSG